jgi:hypothetical protein
MNLREVQATIANIIGKRADAVDKLNRLTMIEDRFNPENITAINSYKQAIEELSKELNRLEVEKGALLEAEEAARKEYVAALAAYDELYGRFPNAEKEAGELLKRYAKHVEAAQRAREILMTKMTALAAVSGAYLPIPPQIGHAWREYAREYAFEIEHKGGV